MATRCPSGELSYAVRVLDLNDRPDPDGAGAAPTRIRFWVDASFAGGDLVLQVARDLDTGAVEGQGFINWTDTTRSDSSTAIPGVVARWDTAANEVTMSIPVAVLTAAARSDRRQAITGDTPIRQVTASDWVAFARSSVNEEAGDMASSAMDPGPLCGSSP